MSQVNHPTTQLSQIIRITLKSCNVYLFESQTSVRACKMAGDTVMYEELTNSVDILAAPEDWFTNVSEEDKKLVWDTMKIKL